MSIIMISGVPGSGKSIKAVEDFLLPALKEGRDKLWQVLTLLMIKIY